jgi:hypothetical protein
LFLACILECRQLILKKINGGRKKRSDVLGNLQQALSTDFWSGKKWIICRPCKFRGLIEWLIDWLIDWLLCGKDYGLSKIAWRFISSKTTPLKCSYRCKYTTRTATQQRHVTKFFN